MLIMPFGLPLELLAPGTYELEKGKFVHFDGADFVRMAKAFNELQPKRKAPVIIGHETDDVNTNVQATVESLRVWENRLLGDLENFATETFIAAIENKTYMRYQPSFWGPEHPDNPKPGAWILSHIAVLGPPLEPIRGSLVTQAQFMEYQREGEGRKLRPELRFGTAGRIEFAEFDLLPTDAAEMARRARACMEFLAAKGVHISVTQAVSFVTTLRRGAAEFHESGKPGATEAVSFVSPLDENDDG